MILHEMLVLFLMMSYSKAREHSKQHEEIQSKKQVVVVPQQSRHSPDVVVVGRGYEGSGEEQIDKDTITSLSNNVMAATNLLHSQSDFINNLGKNLELLEHEAQEQKAKLAEEVTTQLGRYSEIKESQQNITKLVNALVVMWTQSEKNYVKIIKEIKGKIEEEGRFTDHIKAKIDKRFKDLDERLYIIQTGSENARRLAASKRSRWPRGHYCVLANGPCPLGFQRHSGFLKGIYVYGSSKNFIKSERYGSSYIGCYNKNCGGYSNYASLNIETCCK